MEVKSRWKPEVGEEVMTWTGARVVVRGVYADEAWVEYREGCMGGRYHIIQFQFLRPVKRTAAELCEAAWNLPTNDKQRWCASALPLFEEAMRD